MLTNATSAAATIPTNPIITAALQKLGEALYLHNAQAEEIDSVTESIDYLASCGVLE